MESIQILSPKDLNIDEWKKIQGLSNDAFSASLSRPQSEIDYLTSKSEPERFVVSRVYPNSEVGQRFNDNQRFYFPKVAVVNDGSDFVGFAYAADNVSGDSRLARARKMLGTEKRYLWLREVTVRSDFRRHNLTKRMIAHILYNSLPSQPVTAYVWPDEVSFLPDVLRRYGFESTGEQQVKPFGEHAKSVRQVRMLAPSVSGLLNKLINKT